jgi:hypothetical protein
MVTTIAVNAFGNLHLAVGGRKTGLLPQFPSEQVGMCVNFPAGSSINRIK